MLVERTHMRTRGNDEVSRWQRKYLHVKLINFAFCRWRYRVNTHTLSAYIRFKSAAEQI